MPVPIYCLKPVRVWENIYNLQVFSICSMIQSNVQFSSVQSLSCVLLSVIPWIVACLASLSITNSRSSPKPTSIESAMPSNNLILCHPLLLLPSIFPSIRDFSNESALHIRWSKYWSFSFNISPSMNTQDWSPLGWIGWISLQSKGLSRVLQYHSSKASILWHSAFFIVQLSHPCMTTGKTIALTRWTFVDKVMSLLFNMLSRMVTTLPPRSKRLLISWLQSQSAVILEPPKIKSVTVSAVSLSISHEVMGPDVMILVFWMLNSKPTFSLSSFTFIKRQRGRLKNRFINKQVTGICHRSGEGYHLGNAGWLSRQSSTDGLLPW